MTVHQLLRARFAALALLLLPVLLLIAGQTAAETAVQHDLLKGLPEKWAQTLSAGNTANILALYSDHAVIHDVHLNLELHGKDQIRQHYQDSRNQPPQITIVSVDDSKVFGQTGLLSGELSIQYPGNPPMQARYSLACTWENGVWIIDIQHTASATVMPMPAG